MQTIIKYITPLDECITTSITIESDAIYTSRVINNKMFTIQVEITSVNDMLAKCKRISQLTNDMYKILGTIGSSEDYII